MQVMLETYWSGGTSKEFCKPVSGGWTQTWTWWYLQTQLFSDTRFCISWHDTNCEIYL